MASDIGKVSELDWKEESWQDYIENDVSRRLEALLGLADDYGCFD